MMPPTVGYVIDHGHVVHASCRAPYELQRHGGKMLTPEAVIHKWTGARCAYCAGTGPEPAQKKKPEAKATQVGLFAGARVGFKDLDLGPKTTKIGGAPSGQRSLF